LHLGLSARCLIAAGIVLAGSACGSTGPSEEDILEQGERMVKPVPGLYASTTALEEFEMPGASLQEAARMRERMGGIEPQMREFCMSPEEAEQGFAQMLAQSQSGNCRFSRFVVNDRRLSASMTCEDPTGYHASVEMDGLGGERESHLTLRILQQGPGIAGGSLRMRMQVDNQHLGDCV
jgi:hypothetical protein